MAESQRTSPEVRLGARSLAGLFFAGASLSALSLVLPHDGDANAAGLLTISGIAYVVAAVLFFGADRLPAIALPVTLAWGSVSITGVAYFSAQSPSALIFFYLWVFLFSAYFFTRPVAVLEVVWIGLLFGWLLLERPPTGGAATWWIVSMGSLLVAVVLVTGMRERSEHLIARLTHTAAERRRAEQELARHRDQLEELVLERTAALSVVNQELEAFSYSVSHDLRAPLRSLDGFSQALLEDYGESLDEEGSDYLKRIRAGSQRMAQLIDDMLRLSRVSRSEIRRGQVDVSALAEAAAAGLREREPERTVEFRIAPGVSAIADERLLRVVLENLLGNAWKFTSHQSRATIELGTIADDGTLTYFVGDDGAGFDMAHAGKLFGAFQRLHPRQEYDGTGIGLATVQRIVSRHGGRVWAESEPGEGARFFFTLAGRDGS